MKKGFNWFDKAENLKKLRLISYVALALSVIAEFFIPQHTKHFLWDEIPGAYALFGFVTCVFMIVISKIAGQFWLKKSEDYYDK